MSVSDFHLQLLSSVNMKCMTSFYLILSFFTCHVVAVVALPPAYIRRLILSSIISVREKVFKRGVNFIRGERNTFDATAKASQKRNQNQKDGVKTGKEATEKFASI